MSAGGVESVFRWIMLSIDNVVYWLIEKICEIFWLLSRGSIFSQTDFDNITNRIYLLVALVMLFRLAFSFVNYIINPEQLVDKQKGGGKLVIQIVVSLCLLVFTPLLFNEAYHLQAQIIEQDIIGKIVAGNTSQAYGPSFSKNMSYRIFRGFFKIDDSIYLQYCPDMKTADESCIAAIDEIVPDKKIASQLALADNNQSISVLSKADIVTDITVAYSNGLMAATYVIDYKPLISTITGLLVAYLLICFCIDVAIRMVKLGFLQLIAPIPIVMSLAPGQKKNPLSAWGSECFTTYISLFIRLLVIYLAFFIIDLMVGSVRHGVIDIIEGHNTIGWQGTFVNLFAIIGALLFAKEAPKLIEQLFGMKGSSLTLNPLKKLKEISDVPVAGGLAMGAGALAGGLAGTAGTALWGLGRAAGDVIAGNGQAGTRLRETGARSLSHLGASFAGAGSHAWAGITGGKATGVHDRYKNNVNNIKKDYQSVYSALEGRSQGEKLFKKYDKDASNYGIYKSDAFASAVRNVDLAKKARDDAQSEYEKASRGFEANQASIRENAYNQTYAEEMKTISADEAKLARDRKNHHIPKSELDARQAAIDARKISAKNRAIQAGNDAIETRVGEIDELRKAYGKAEGTFNKAKAELDDRKKVYKRDAERYERYSAADDRHSLDKFQSPTNTNISRNNGSNSDTSSTSSFGDSHTNNVNPFEGKK